MSDEQRACAERHHAEAAEYLARNGADLFTECDSGHPQLDCDECDGVHCYRACDEVARAQCRHDYKTRAK